MIDPEDFNIDDAAIDSLNTMYVGDAIYVEKRGPEQVRVTTRWLGATSNEIFFGPDELERFVDIMTRWGYLPKPTTGG